LFPFRLMFPNQQPNKFGNIKRNGNNEKSLGWLILYLITLLWCTILHWLWGSNKIHKYTIQMARRKFEFDKGIRSENIWNLTFRQVNPLDPTFKQGYRIGKYWRPNLRTRVYDPKMYIRSVNTSDDTFKQTLLGDIVLEPHSQRKKNMHRKKTW
jgi:hypothetical protein